MKYTFLLLLSLLFSLTSWAQDSCIYSMEYSVHAESGMRIRSQPTSNSPVVTYVFHDSIVEACELEFAPDTIENIIGHWKKVRYKGNEGYMFDGFLTLVEIPITPDVFEPKTSIDSFPPEEIEMDSSLFVDEFSDTPQVVHWLFDGDDTLATFSFESAPKDTVQPITSVEEWDTIPKFTWQRTERDSIPSAGNLDGKQIRQLATLLNKTDLRRDSLIGFLYTLPTLGSQDSVIAWIEAGMPKVLPFAKSSMDSTLSDSIHSVSIPPDTLNEPKGPPALELQLATEAYNYCGDISALNPSLNWYGLFPDEAMGGYSMKRVELELIVSKSRLGRSMEFDIRNSSGLPAHFLFGVNRLLDTTLFFQLSPEHFTIVSPRLFPGQQLEAYAKFNRPSAANVFISAVGNVIEVGACPVIENYALKINTQGPKGPIVQNITPLFPSLGSCGMPEIYWFGDLNNDNYPELIYVSPSSNKNQFTLLLSDISNENELYSIGAVWTIETCQ